MKLIRVAVALALVCLAGCAYDNPGAPGSVAPDLSAPSQLTLGASATQSGNSTLTARVQNSYGAPLANVMVTFATTRGAILPTQATTGSSGTATAILAAVDTADVTVVAGGLTAHTLVVPSTPTSPTPTTPTAAAFLNVSPNATTGVPLVFSVSSAATGVTWFWSFGDGANEQGTSFTTTHTYTHAGTYTASVSSPSTAASSTTITAKDPPVVSNPTPTNTLVAVLTCTAGTHGPAGSATVCNVSVTFGGVPIGGGTVTRVEWDWGDGTTVDNLTTVPVNTHIYANLGTYTVFATVTATPIDTPTTARTSTTVTPK
jgi:PKD repeat protein